MFMPIHVHSGLVRGFACAVTGRKFTTTADESAEVEKLRLEAESYTTSVVDAVDAKHGAENRSAATYGLLHRLMTGETNVNQ